MIKRKWRVLLFPLAILLVLLVWEWPPYKNTTEIPIKPLPMNSTTSNTQGEPVLDLGSKATTNIRLTLLGDIMCHPTQYEVAKTPDGYDFRPAFEDIMEYTSKADLTLANLETAMAGKEKIYGGYPSFNTPEQLAIALKETLEIDVLATANNHSLDRHYSGLSNTIDFLDEAGLKHTGTYRTEEESKEILIVDVKDLKIAFLSYTYGTNGIILPSDKQFAVNYIDRNKILKDAQEARALGAHLIIAFIHWGEEYAHKPSAQQVSLAHWVFEKTEVDIISGNHVHAVQPIEFINVIRDNGTQKDGLVVYAQGNFFSNQKTKSANRSIMVDIDLEFSLIDDDVKIEQVYYTPLWIDETLEAGSKTYRVLNAEKAINDFRQGQDELLNQSDYNKMTEFVTLIKSLLPQQEKVVYGLAY